MKFTHTWDNCLAWLFVGFNSKCRVFFCEFRKTDTEFIEVSLRFWFYSDTDNRIREIHRLESNRVRFVAESITGADIFETDTCAYITGSNFFNWVLFVWVHLEKAGDTFFFLCTSIVNVRACFYFTWVNSEVAEATYIRVCSDFECECSKRLVIVWFTSDNLFRVTRVGTGDFRGIERRREVSTNCIEERLNTFIFERRTADDRVQVHRESSFTECGFNFRFSNSRRVVEIFLHDSVIKRGDIFEHFISPFLSFCEVFRRDFV